MVTILTVGGSDWQWVAVIGSDGSDGSGGSGDSEWQ